jgi:hypothetical protein
MKIRSKRTITCLLIWLVTVFFNSAYALPPAAPVLQLEIQGLEVTAKWDSSSGVHGYRLAYTPISDLGCGLSNMDISDLGYQHSSSRTFRNGDSFYVAVKAGSGFFLTDKNSLLI